MSLIKNYLPFCHFDVNFCKPPGVLMEKSMKIQFKDLSELNPPEIYIDIVSAWFWYGRVLGTKKTYTMRIRVVLFIEIEGARPFFPSR